MILDTGNEKGTDTVPDPGTDAALFGLATLTLGAAGLRRWRKVKQAA